MFSIGLNLPLSLNTEGETLVFLLVLVPADLFLVLLVGVLVPEDLILVLVFEVLLTNSDCGSRTELVLGLLSETRPTADLTWRHKHRFQT